jgi:cytochrome c-type biogenesis protein CcmH
MKYDLGNQINKSSKKLEKDYGETILYAPRFDIQTVALWLSPFVVGGSLAGLWAY